MKKVGIIELNSTNLKLVTADVLESQSFVVTDRFEDKIQIASDLYADELIKNPSILAVTNILKTYKATLNSYGITEIYCFASSEYLNAKNQRSFFDELYSSTGFRFKILSTSEEANYLYYAFLNSLDCPKGLILNINGTNTQILAYNRRNCLEQFDVLEGSIGLAEKYVGKDLSVESAMSEMTKEFAKQIDSIDWFETLDDETQIVGTGDVFVSISKLSQKLKKYPYQKDHAYQFSKEDLDKVYDFVKTLDIDKTKKLKGISAQRADVLASGIAMVKAFAEKSGIARFIVSTNSVAEGYLFNKVAQGSQEKPTSDVLGTSLQTIYEYYNNSNLKNIENIYDLSLILFKQLKVLHKLPRNFVKVLRIASFMHDCGKRISPVNYEKKGFNVVLDSEIYGVAHHEQVLAGFVVACQKLENFSMVDWVRFNSILSEEDLEGVRRLAVIVRLATVLDMFGLGKVKDISCDILGDSVIMKTIVEQPADMEIMEGLKVSSDFAKAFKKHLEILSITNFNKKWKYPLFCWIFL